MLIYLCTSKESYWFFLNYALGWSRHSKNSWIFAESEMLPAFSSIFLKVWNQKEKKWRESEEWVVIWQAGLTLICFLTKWARNYKYFNQCRDLLKHWRFSWGHLKFSDMSSVLYSKAQFLKISLSFIKVLQQD